MKSDYMRLRRVLTRRIEKMYCSWIVILETPSVHDLDPCVLDLPGIYISGRLPKHGQNSDKQHANILLVGQWFEDYFLELFG